MNPVSPLPRRPAPKKKRDPYQIQVWPGEKAPARLKAHCALGFSPSWVALIPRTLAVEYPVVPWLEVGSAFGPTSVDSVTLPNGDVLKIGYLS